jgi:dTDP-4-dehydrorhamnose reductase
MKVVVVGASGFLGQKLMEEFSPYHSSVGTYSSKKLPGLRKLDITKRSQVARFIETHSPNLIIHAAGLTDVDLCEREQDLAYQVNIAGTENILDVYRGRIIYVSTDFVFDGFKGDYREEDRVRPISYYGFTKTESERLVQNSGNHYIIARVAVLYGHIIRHVKFVNWALGQLRQGRPVRAVKDHIRTPTLIDDIAKALLALAAKDQRGTFHVAGPQALSSYEMARKIAEHFSLPKRLVRPVSASGLKQDAQRPRDSSLNTDKLRGLGIDMSSFDRGLETLKKQMGDMK